VAFLVALMEARKTDSAVVPPRSAAKPAVQTFEALLDSPAPEVPPDAVAAQVFPAVG
jgi:hypothetical protein